MQSQRKDSGLSAEGKEKSPVKLEKNKEEQRKVVVPQKCKRTKSWRILYVKVRHM
jgi:hypothetical protein